YEADLVSRRAVTGCAVGSELGFVELDQVLHLAALAINGFIDMSRGALERGNDVADIDLLTHAAFSVWVRLQRDLEARDHAAWARPTPGLVFKARVTAHLVLASEGMIYAQIIGRPGNHRIEHVVAGKPKNVVDIVVFCPFHDFVAAIVAITPPDETRLRPVRAYATRDMLDDGPHLRAFRCFGGPQDRHHRRTAAHMIDMHG